MASTSSDQVVATYADVNKDDIIILVLGATGSGKSSFISSATGERVVVGHKLESCTDTVRPVARQLPDGRRLILLDTPGLNDTNLADIDVLENIAGWLAATYELEIRVRGAIMLHPISDNRMSGASLRCLRLVTQLLGSQNLSHLVLVSSMWDRVDATSGLARETELCSEAAYWQPFLQAGAKKAHYYRSLSEPESAEEAVSLLINLPPIVLRIQEEVVDMRLPLIQTDAGKVVDGGLSKLADQQRAAIAALEQEHQDALRQQCRNVGLVREERRRQVATLEQIERERARLGRQNFWRDMRNLIFTVARTFLARHLPVGHF